MAQRLSGKFLRGIVLSTCRRRKVSISNFVCVSRTFSNRLLTKNAHSLGVNRPVIAYFSSKGDVIEVPGPAFAESISEGDIKWLKKKGDFVKEDDLIAEIETDKTTVEVPAPQAGTIEELLVEEGSKVTAKQKLYKLRVGGEAPKTTEEPSKPDKPAAKADKPDKPAAKPDKHAPPPEQPKESKPKPAEQKQTPPRPADVASPIPSMAPPPSLFRPSEPVSSKPVSSMKPAAAQAASSHVSPEKAITGSRTETRVKMNRMRQRIAQRLKDAQNTYAMLTTFNEIDMSNLIALRNKHKDAFAKKHGVKFGFMSPFVKAAAYALLDQPVVNAVIDEGEIVYRHFIDISVAVATPKGLVVPVLRNVETMNYAQIEKEINDLGVKARDNKLAIEDMEGGTFTISNGGVFGSLFGTPIINPPQSAILGMHATNDRPVAVNGKVEIRPIMIVALTYDHRLVDGREAVTFLKKIKTAVEDPASMLLEL